MDTPILTTGNITVSRTLVRVGKKSYPVNGIGSVETRYPDKGSAKLLIFLALGSAVILAVLQNFTWAVAVTFVGLCALAYMRGMKTKLIFHTASGESAAVESTDTGLIDRVHQAVETAVSQRG